MNIFRNPPESQVKHLLAEAKLPSSDLSARHLVDSRGKGYGRALVAGAERSPR